ncbi:MAG: MCE family protein [Candidatus Omnitrophica bacterium]|nr:MCE family protein [Candidatus Omnitrophota bacterium]
MVFGKTKLELKVGVFVFFGLVVLAAFVLIIGKFTTWNSGYHVNFVFHFVNGVKVGAPVRFAGVDVGEVKEVSIERDHADNVTKVKLGAWVKNEVKIPLDSSVWVNTLGLMGERYVEIIPGKQYASVLQENETLTGTDPIAMHEVAQLAKQITSHLDESIQRINNKEGTVGKLLYDDTIYEVMESTMRELEALAVDIRKHPWKLMIKGKEQK